MDTDLAPNRNTPSLGPASLLPTVLCLLHLHLLWPLTKTPEGRESSPGAQKWYCKNLGLIPGIPDSS